MILSFFSVIFKIDASMTMSYPVFNNMKGNVAIIEIRGYLFFVTSSKIYNKITKCTMKVNKRSALSSTFDYGGFELSPSSLLRTLCSSTLRVICRMFPDRNLLNRMHSASEENIPLMSKSEFSSNDPLAEVGVSSNADTALVSSRTKHILLDLTQVVYWDSSAIYNCLAPLISLLRYNDFIVSFGISHDDLKHHLVKANVISLQDHIFSSKTAAFDYFKNVTREDPNFGL